MPIYRAFEQISDGRHKRGVRYSAALILTLIVLAKAAGMTTLQGIAEWVRLRWAIENRSHYRRDVSLREDHCQVRNGEAPRVLAVLNSGLLALLRFAGSH